MASSKPKIKSRAPSTRGGARPGAGRKPGYGPYGEATEVLRVPASQIDVVQEFLNDYREQVSASKETMKKLMGQMMLPFDEPTRQHIPLYSTKVRAGFPSPADDYVDERLDLNELLVQNAPATFFFRIEGCSMINAGIFEGDIAIVDRSIEPNHRDIVLAIVDGGHTIKRLIKQNGEIRLDAENPAQPPIILKEGMEMTVLGVIKHCIHTLK